MQPIAAYVITLNQQAGRRSFGSTPRPTAPRSPRPGLAQRVRRLFGSGPRLVREPGFAASEGWIDEVVPTLSAYPYPSNAG